MTVGTMIYELSSTWGATVAFLVFLVMSLAVAMVLYLVLVRSPLRRSPFQNEPAIRGPFAAVLSTLVFGLVFGVLYATTLRGFYRVELDEDMVRLHYLFPSHTVSVSRFEIAQAERVRAHEGRWHLRLHTRQGETYQSALAPDRAVRESWEGLSAYLEHGGRP